MRAGMACRCFADVSIHYRACACNVSLFVLCFFYLYFAKFSFVLGNKFLHQPDKLCGCGTPLVFAYMAELGKKNAIHPEAHVAVSFFAHTSTFQVSLK